MAPTLRLSRPRGGGFRTLWLATASSNLGDGMALVAAPLLAATLTADPAAIAGLTFAQRLPWLLFPILGGALADRLDRRRLMVAVALARAALVAALAAALLTDRASLPLLYAVFFLLSSGETLFDTAAATILPAIVPRVGLPRANARLSAALTVTNQFVGPPLGGALFAVAVALPFLVGGGGLAAAAAILLTLRGTFRAPAEGRIGGAGLRAEVGEGIRWLWGQPTLRTLALALAALNLTLVAQNAIMVLYAQQRLGLDARGFGLLLTTYGLGGIAGGLVAGPISDRFGAGTLLRLALTVELLVPAALALTRAPLLAGAILALFGCHAIVFGAVLASLRQSLVPDALRGRVGGAFRFIEDGDRRAGRVTRRGLGRARRADRPLLVRRAGGGDRAALGVAQDSRARIGGSRQSAENGSAVGSRRSAERTGP